MYYFRYNVLKWLFSGAGPVTLDTLSLLEDAAERDADGEEEDGCGDAGGRVVVLDAAAAVGAVVPANTTTWFLSQVIMCRLSATTTSSRGTKTETFLVILNVIMQQNYF